ncbi:MAG: hypothetical protein BWY32_01378 [bacterium ADurb.Bin243]|nr:MAG: hypothetical protein BWY32_01378 [bacterium ADurb.Bin243]
MIALQFTTALTSAPVVNDFQIRKVVNGTEFTENITPTSINWLGASNPMACDLNVPMIQPMNVNQFVTYKVSYKGGAFIAQSNDAFLVQMQTTTAISAPSNVTYHLPYNKVTWDMITSAGNYDYWLKFDGGTPVLAGNNVTEFMVPGTVTAGIEHNVSVAAKDANGNWGAWSALVYFTPTGGGTTTVMAPTMTPPSGSTNISSVELANTQGAEMYYVITNTQPMPGVTDPDPATSGTLYTGPITISPTQFTRIIAVCKLNGVYSAPYMSGYNMTTPPPAPKLTGSK